MASDYWVTCRCPEHGLIVHSCPRRLRVSGLQQPARVFYLCRPLRATPFFSRGDRPLESRIVGLGGQIGYLPSKRASARLPWPQVLCRSLHREPTEGLERLGDARLLAGAAESNVAVAPLQVSRLQVAQIPVEAEAAREFFGGLSTSASGQSSPCRDARSTVKRRQLRTGLRPGHCTRIIGLPHSSSNTFP